MKKFTVGRAYKAVEQITPPFILSGIKKTGAYRKIATSAKNRLAKDHSPSWQTISTGPLKGAQLFLDPKGEWQQEMLGGAYDNFFFDFVDKINLSGKTIYDIGAHIGFNTLYFAHRVGHNGKVFAFEPNKVNLERIDMIMSKNAELGKRVTVINKAVSNKTGKTTFVLSDVVDDGSSCGGFVADADTAYEKDSYQKARGFHETTVETTSIDDMIASKKYPVPDLLKVDIEGAEYLAIEGMKTLLTQHKPILLIEIHSTFNMLSVGESLRDFNYKIELLKEESSSRCFIAALPKK